MRPLGDACEAEHPPRAERQELAPLDEAAPGTGVIAERGWIERVPGLRERAARRPERALARVERELAPTPVPRNPSTPATPPAARAPPGSEFAQLLGAHVDPRTGAKDVPAIGHSATRFPSMARRVNRSRSSSRECGPRLVVDVGKGSARTRPPTKAPLRVVRSAGEIDRALPTRRVHERGEHGGGRAARRRGAGAARRSRRTRGGSPATRTAPAARTSPRGPGRLDARRGRPRGGLGRGLGRGRAGDRIRGALRVRVGGGRLPRGGGEREDGEQCGGGSGSHRERRGEVSRIAARAQRAPAGTPTSERAAPWLAGTAWSARGWGPRPSPPPRGTSCTSCPSRTGTDRSARPWAACGRRSPASGAASSSPSRSAAAAWVSVIRCIARRWAASRFCSISAAALLADELEAKEVADDRALHAPGHLHEHLVAFLLVLLLRVLLAVAAQADALAQVVHREQVVLPLLVDGLEVEPLLVAASTGAPSASTPSSSSFWR